VYPKAISKKIEAFLPRILDLGLFLIQGQPLMFPLI
jgi:hypothetical protein